MPVVIVIAHLITKLSTSKCSNDTHEINMFAPQLLYTEAWTGTLKMCTHAWKHVKFLQNLPLKLEIL